MAARNLPPNHDRPAPSQASSSALETVEQVIAFTSQDEALKGFSVTIQDGENTCPLICNGSLRIALVAPAQWNDAKLLKKLAKAGNAPGAEVTGDDTFVMMFADSRAPLARLKEVLAAKANMPGWLAEAPVQTTALPASIETWRSTLTSIMLMHQHLAHSRKTGDDLRTESENITHLMSISRELNGERDIPKLLNLILLKAREVCRADAGSIYTIESAVDAAGHGTLVRPGEEVLHFRFTQNHSVKQNLSEFKLPINRNSIVGNAVLARQTIKIPDLYALSPDPAQNPFNIRHDRSWDQRIGYQSRSMLTLPIYDISHQVIGVIQLINCKKDHAKRLLRPEDFENEVTEFDENSVKYAEIVAQQAGIALENAKMTEDITRLFDGLVEASVTAIEQRDPTTSGHSHRVAALTVELARVVDRADTGIYGKVSFDEDQMREIRYASLLHDFGKLGVREAVLVKAKKLFPEDLALIEERFKLVRAAYEIEYLKAMLNLTQRPDLQALGMTPEQLLSERDQRNAILDEFLNFILRANEPTVLEQGGFDRLKDIANVHFRDISNADRKLLQDHELKALSVSRGSLTAEEYAEIQSHVVHTYEFLRKIPWGKKLANVPQIAAKHHEKLDGSGYPTSAVAEQIPVQSRMMTIADIYDALSAADRPYKKSLPPEKALDILAMEVKGGKLDAELFRLFVDSKAYLIVHPGGSASSSAGDHPVTGLKKGA